MDFPPPAPRIRWALEPCRFPRQHGRALRVGIERISATSAERREDGVAVHRQAQNQPRAMVLVEKGS